MDEAKTHFLELLKDESFNDLISFIPIYYEKKRINNEHSRELEGYSEKDISATKKKISSQQNQIAQFGVITSVE